MEPRRPARLGIRLLGPFDARGHGGAIRLPGVGERALLALLALSSGRSVAAATLIEQLWEASAPQDPLNALHQRVSKLRWALSAECVADLPHQRRSELPAERDHRRHRRAHLAVARHTGDPHQAVATYDEALELWHGAPLVDFREMRWAKAEAARLQELRRAGVSERADRCSAWAASSSWCLTSSPLSGRTRSMSATRPC